MCHDLQDLIRGIVAYSLDALLGASRRQNHKRRLVSLDMFRQLYWAPFGTLTLVPTGASNTLPSIRDPISPGEHYEMLLFIAVKAHWRAATGSDNGSNNRLGPIRVCSGKPHCYTFTGSSFVQGPYQLYFPDRQANMM